MIDLLTICIWGDRFYESIDVVDPDWPTIERAIRNLNEVDRNDIYLHPDKNDLETYLSVGGGNGRYVVSGSVRNLTFSTVVDPQKSATEKELLYTGGQDGWYPSNCVVDLETALHAAKAFYESGTFGTGVNWQNV